jgi:peptidoglycan/xylan/chitin deacetylase (PgdA/CDA1 family)
LATKIVVYHYVRTRRTDLPNFPFLHVKDFKDQLNYFNQNFHLIDYRDFFSDNVVLDTSEKVLLTFDDGFKDHYTAVLPILSELGVKGLFFLNSLQYQQNRLLDVHRIHFLLGKIGSLRFGHALQKKIGHIFNTKGDDFSSAGRYAHQNTDARAKQIKFLLNYQTEAGAREYLLKGLMERHFGDETAMAAELYLNKTEIVELHRLGHAIGAHSHSHYVLSNETEATQRNEIESNKTYLENLLKKPINLFCYPYGGRGTYNDTTIRLVKVAGFKYAFSMNHEDLSPEWQSDQSMTLPRFDCNCFPSGSASI